MSVFKKGVMKKTLIFSTKGVLLPRHKKKPPEVLEASRYEGQSALLERIFPF